MTVGSSGSIPLAFALQNAGGGIAAATIRSDDSTWSESSGNEVGYPTDSDYKILPVHQSSIAPVKVMEQYGREIDESYHDTGLYTRYFAGGGSITMSPRIAGDINELLAALVGGVKDTGFDIETGHLYGTRFAPPDDARDFPWLAVRTQVNGASSSDNKLMQYYDGRVASGVLSMAGGTPMSLQASLIFRKFEQLSDTSFSSAMTWSTEEEDVIPLSTGGLAPTLTEVVGEITGMDSLKVLSVQVAINNGFSSANPQQELLIGDKFLDDMALGSQSVAIQLGVKYKNPELYNAYMNGDIASNTESTAVLRTGLEFYASTPKTVGGVNLKLRFKATEVAWQVSPPTLIAGGFLFQQITGVVMKQPSASDAYEIVLENEYNTDASVTYDPAWSGYTE